MNNILEMIKNEKVEWKKLGDVCECKRGSTITKKQVKPGKVPVIAGGQEPAYYHSESNRIGETITVAGSGVNAGYVNYWNIPIFLSDAFSVHPENCILIKYLYYFLSSKQFEIYNLKKGCGIPHVYYEDLEKIEIPIPSLETQERIVKILDTMVDHFTQLEAELEAELEARNKQYEYYRDKLLSEEYLNKLTKKYNSDCSSNYVVQKSTLGELAKINRGASPRPIRSFITNSKDGVPWIKISDAEVNAKFIFSTKQKITKEGAKKSRLLKKGDFIISNSMSYGRPYILAIEGCIHDGWASISDYENNLNSDFLYHFLSSNYVQRYWLMKMNSSSVSNLNSSIIESLPITLVDIDLQEKIANVLDAFLDITQDVSGLLPKEIELRQKQYEYYRERLLDFKRDDDE